MDAKQTYTYSYALNVTVDRKTNKCIEIKISGVDGEVGDKIYIKTGMDNNSFRAYMTPAGTWEGDLKASGRDYRIALHPTDLEAFGKQVLEGRIN